MQHGCLGCGTGIGAESEETLAAKERKERKESKESKRGREREKKW